MLKAIFFDLWGTLLNSQVSLSGKLKAIEKVIELYNLDKKPSEYLPLAEKAYNVVGEMVESVEKGRGPNESIQEFGVRALKAVYARLMDLMGGEPDEKRVELVFRAHLEGIATADSLFPGVRGVLRALKGRYRLGLISNNIVEYVKGPLQHLDLEEFFDVVLISGEENVRKPDPEIFHRALKRIGVSSSEAMMIGDNILDDVGGAKGVGMTAVWVNRSDEEPMKPDYTIGNLSGLLDVLQTNRKYNDEMMSRTSSKHQEREWI